MYCEKCGNKLPDDAKFCDKCGNKTTSTTEEQPVNNDVNVRKQSEKHMINFNFFILITIFYFQFFYIFFNYYFVFFV